MARRAFFSFHYKNDVSRANVVRHSWVTKPDTETAGFIDAAEFEEVKKKGDAEIHKWIDKQLEGTTVTVVLIGAETNKRDYIKYEIKRSYSKGNGMIGIYIHNIKNLQAETSAKGSNQFGEIGKDSKGNPVYFSSDYSCYDWVDDDGYKNLGAWVEEAAKKAGK